MRKQRVGGWGYLCRRGGWGGQPCWSATWKTTTETCLTWSPDAHVLLAIHDKASHWLSVGVIRCSLADYKSTQHSFLVTGGGGRGGRSGGRRGGEKTRGHGEHTKQTPFLNHNSSRLSDQFCAHLGALGFRCYLCSRNSVDAQMYAWDSVWLFHNGH